MKKVDHGSTNRDIIISYLESGGLCVELTEQQKTDLERWTFADEMIRTHHGRKKRHEIASLIIARYSVSMPTAYSYMVNAEIVFSSSTPLNKKYTIGLRIELLIREIGKCVSENKFKEHAMLESCLQKYLDMYPDDKPNIAPRTFVFNVDARTINDEVLKTEDADFEIQQALKNLPNAASE